MLVGLTCEREGVDAELDLVAVEHDVTVGGDVGGGDLDGLRLPGPPAAHGEGLLQHQHLTLPPLVLLQIMRHTKIYTSLLSRVGLSVRPVGSNELSHGHLAHAPAS